MGGPRAQQDQLLTYLQREEERVLTKVLPRRFALARLDVQPVAVEYRFLPEAGKNHEG